MKHINLFFFSPQSKSKIRSKISFMFVSSLELCCVNLSNIFFCSHQIEEKIVFFCCKDFCLVNQNQRKLIKYMVTNKIRRISILFFISKTNSKAKQNVKNHYFKLIIKYFYILFILAATKKGEITSLSAENN